MPKRYRIDVPVKHPSLHRVRRLTRVALVSVMLVACGSDDDVTTALLGAECAVDAECEDRCLVPSNDYPDGMCTLGCEVNLDCPDESDCIDKEGGVCLFVCDFDEDCAFLGPEWICRDENLREDQNVRSGVCLGD